MTKRSTDDKIAEPEMHDALKRSGYLLEQQIAASLREAGYKVMTNGRFIDPETSKSLEYDVYAYKAIRVDDGPETYEIYPTLICECKNNSHPIMFIDNPNFTPLRDEVTVSGIPCKIWQRDRFISVQEYIGVDNFHHFCKQIAPVANMCVTFEKNKEDGLWKANHGGDLHSTFVKMSKALEYKIDQDFGYMGQWFLPGERETEFMDLSFYYPVVIYRGDLYVYFADKAKMGTCEHVQFNPEFFSTANNEILSYHIDVISQAGLKSYLETIDREMMRICRTLKQRKREVLLSTRKIAEQCKRQKIKPKTYRGFLEHKF
jgi:hypothetical protein